ncbi:MAG: T9SS type A sorting domain-containing protein [Crocinitomix sp.]|nr:T9SS type A sorting domain-containing protein [Crocinitomix sp.]
MIKHIAFPTLILSLLLVRQTIYAQQFTEVTTGVMVTIPSGSRSANFLDMNNDNYQDILITNGKTGGEINLLYLNNGDGTFTFLSGDTITSESKPSDGATCADYDNDGFIDICAVNWYNDDNLLYNNNGDNSFSKIGAGIIPTDAGYSETAAWGDFNNDGLLDLFVTNSAGTNRNYFYQNEGDGIFTKIDDITPTLASYRSRCVNWIDYDQDGDQDLFIANEGSHKNNIYRNDGDMLFTKILEDTVVTDVSSSISSSWADYDNDGDFDLLIANYEQKNQLFRNDGLGNFSLVPDAFGTDIGCSFSSSFADYDNDGDLDLMITNGFCEADLENFLYENNGDGTFTRNMTEAIATNLGGSYGCAWGDYDNDGFQDLVVANWQDETQENSLYHNNGNANNWLEINLEGVLSNRSAIGAIIRCKALIDGVSVWQTREVSAQTGYCSQNSLVVHFGLGTATVVDSLQIKWPSGIQQNFTDLNTNNYYTLIENETIEVLALEEFSGSSSTFTVSPNPSNGDITIESADLTENYITVEIVNLQGEVVYKKRMWSQSNKLQLSLSNQLGAISDGIYIIRVSTDQLPLLESQIIIQ